MAFIVSKLANDQVLHTFQPTEKVMNGVALPEKSFYVKGKQSAIREENDYPSKVAGVTEIPEDQKDVFAIVSKQEPFTTWVADGVVAVVNSDSAKAIETAIKKLTGVDNSSLLNAETIYDGVDKKTAKKIKVKIDSVGA